MSNNEDCSEGASSAAASSSRVDPLGSLDDERSLFLEEKRTWELVSRAAAAQNKLQIVLEQRSQKAREWLAELKEVLELAVFDVKTAENEERIFKHTLRNKLADAAASSQTCACRALNHEPWCDSAPTKLSSTASATIRRRTNTAVSASPPTPTQATMGNDDETAMWESFLASAPSHSPKQEKNEEDEGNK